jgi:hypothetical protein
MSASLMDVPTRHPTQCALFPAADWLAYEQCTNAQNLGRTIRKVSQMHSVQHTTTNAGTHALLFRPPRNTQMFRSTAAQTTRHHKQAHSNTATTHLAVETQSECKYTARVPFKRLQACAIVTRPHADCAVPRRRVDSAIRPSGKSLDTVRVPLECGQR